MSKLPTCLGCGEIRPMVYWDYESSIGAMRFCYECTKELQLTDMHKLEPKVVCCDKCGYFYIPYNRASCTFFCKVCYLKNRGIKKTKSVTVTVQGVLS